LSLEYLYLGQGLKNLSPLEEAKKELNIKFLSKAEKILKQQKIQLTEKLLVKL
jgi:hypothetical protein